MNTAELNEFAIIGYLANRSRTLEDLAELSGLAMPQLLGVTRSLERGGRIRFSRNLYELTGAPDSMRAANEGGAPVAAAPPQPKPTTERIRQPVTPPVVETIVPVAETKPAISATPKAIAETIVAIRATTPPIQATPAAAGATIQEKPMPTGIYERKKAARKASPKAKVDRATGVTNLPRATASESSLLIPESKRVAAGIVDGMVQVAHDPAHMVELTPEQMDQLAAWWSRVRSVEK